MLIRGTPKTFPETERSCGEIAKRRLSWAQPHRPRLVQTGYFIVERAIEVNPMGKRPLR